jgi:hypothetical protein
VRACDGDVHFWSRQHQQLLGALATGRSITFRPWPVDDDEREQAAPPAWLAVPGRVSSIGAFTMWMRRIWVETGWTLADIAAATREPAVVTETGKAEGIPVSTLSDLVNPTCMRIPTWRSLRGFLLAVGASKEAAIEWEKLRIDLVAGREAKHSGCPSRR